MTKSDSHTIDSGGGTGLVSPLVEEGQLLIATCSVDGHSWFPADRYGCQRCGAFGEAIHITAAPPVGVLQFSITVHRYRGPGPEAPFEIGTLRLPSGIMVDALVGDRFAPGTQVRGEWVEYQDGTSRFVFSEDAS